MSIKRVGTFILFCVCNIVIQAQEVAPVLQNVDSINHQPPTALDILNKALTANPNSEELLKVRADAYEMLKQHDKAIADYIQLTKLLPNNERLWYLLGRNQFMNGQLQEAITSLNRATKINSRLIPAFHLKTLIFIQLEKYDAALKASDSTLRIAETAMTYFLQGEVYSRMKSWQKAEWAYSSAIRTDNKYISAYIALANISANNNKATEALEAAELALAIAPDSKDALIARSKAFALLKDFNSAIDDLSYVIELDPNNVEAHYLRGIYYKNNNPQEAIKDFEQVLKLLSNADNYPEKDATIQSANEYILELKRED